MLRIDLASTQLPADAPRVLRFAPDRLRLGRDPKNQIVLAHGGVSRLHAEIYVGAAPRAPALFIRDLESRLGTWVNGTRVTSGGPLLPDDEIRIGPFTLRARLESGPSVVTIAAPAPTDRVPDAGSLTASGAAPVTATTGPTRPPMPLPTAAVALTPADLARLNLRRALHEKLLAAFDLRRVDVHRMADDELRRVTERAVADLIAALDDVPAGIDRSQLAAEVRDEAIGLGLLEPLLADPTINEIMINRADEIFVERGGRLERLPLAFTSERAVTGIIERIVAPIGRRIDESSPMVDARLKDGSRVNAIIPPLALKGPSLTIRRFPTRKLTPDDLLRFGSAHAPMIEFLRIAVEHRKNIIISGGTGSGKTTLLNILSNFIPADERIVTVEDAAELRLHHANLVSLEARPANIEGKGQIAIRDLVKNCLRMRPDRIVVGECRGGEALDMLQAMNTGHDGSLTTAHANSPRDMLARLEVMVLMAGMDLPVTAIREQVASAVDLIVQQTRFACGARRITHICEVTGVEGARIQLQDIFRFEQTGYGADGKTLGHFTGCDFIPEFYEVLRRVGVAVDLGIFGRTAPRSH